MTRDADLLRSGQTCINPVPASCLCGAARRQLSAIGEWRVGRVCLRRSLTPRWAIILGLAEDRSLDQGSLEITPHDLLDAILKEGNSTEALLLAEHGLRCDIVGRCGERKHVAQTRQFRPTLDTDATRLLARSGLEAATRNHRRIEVQDVVVAMMTAERIDPAFLGLGITPDQFMRSVQGVGSQVRELSAKKESGVFVTASEYHAIIRSVAKGSSDVE